MSGIICLAFRVFIKKGLVIHKITRPLVLFWYIFLTQMQEIILFQ